MPKRESAGDFDARSVGRHIHPPPELHISGYNTPDPSFDQVVSMSVEGVNKSAISRVQSLAWNTVHRWLEKVAKSCRQFTRNNTREMDIREIQADEIRTFTGNKRKASWIFATMDVWSRFWPGTVIGSRNYAKTKLAVQSISKLTGPQRVPLITSDGYRFYERAIRKCFGKCLYGQVIKTRRNDRVTKVERRMIIGEKQDFDTALLNSEDSETLNTSSKGNAPRFRRSDKSFPSTMASRSKRASRS